MKLLSYFKKKNHEAQLQRFADVLGEQAAVEELIKYFQRKLKVLNPNEDWWEWAYTKQDLADAKELSDKLTRRANELRPSNWYEDVK